MNIMKIISKKCTSIANEFVSHKCSNNGKMTEKKLTSPANEFLFYKCKNKR